MKIEGREWRTLDVRVAPQTISSPWQKNSDFHSAIALRFNPSPSLTRRTKLWYEA
jgi:hypothetical protein